MTSVVAGEGWYGRHAGVEAASVDASADWQTIFE
jgi:hypothetical protein